MKKILTNIMLFAALICVLASCDKDNVKAIYTDGGTVSFISSKNDVALAAIDNSFEVRINRSTKVGDASYNLIKVEGDDIFNVPTQVAFVNGAGEAFIKVNIAEGMEVGPKYKLVIGVEDGDLSISGVKEITLTVFKEYEWKSIGTGQWTDGMLASVFGVSKFTYPVEVEEAEGVSGLYRVVSPYGFGSYPLTETGDVVGAGNIVIDATDPNAVYLEEQSMGINYGYGVITCGSVYGNLSSNITSYPLGKVNGKLISLGTMFMLMGGDAYTGYLTNTTTLQLP